MISLLSKLPLFKTFSGSDGKLDHEEKKTDVSLPISQGMIAASVRVSDVILIPVQPSPYDIWGASDLVDLIKARQEVTEGKPQAAFIVSRAIKRTILGNEITGALAEYNLPVFRSMTVQRQIYPRTASEGFTVFDDAGKEAAAEINAIADELTDFFKLGRVRYVA